MLNRNPYLAFFCYNNIVRNNQEKTMKKLQQILTFIALFCLLSISCAFAETYEDAVQKQKPFIMYFFATTCPACTQFSPSFQKIASTYSNHITFLNVDANLNSRLLNQYQIRSVPTVLLVNPKNNKRSNISTDAFNTKQGFLFNLESSLLKVK